MRNGLKFFSLLGVLAALGLGLSGYSKAMLKSPEINAMAPDFTGTDSYGKQHKLSDFLGKTVVLEWKNHQCPFVVKHYDSGNMQALQKEATDDGVIWLSVISSTLGKQGYVSMNEANQIAQAEGSHATAILQDVTGEIGRLYGARTTPHMFVIDKEGKLVYDGAIDSIRSANQADIAEATNYVRAALKDLKAGEAVKTQKTTPYGCSVKY